MQTSPLEQKLFSFNDFQELYLKKASGRPFQSLVDLKNEAIERSINKLHTGRIVRYHTTHGSFSHNNGLYIIVEIDDSSENIVLTLNRLDANGLVDEFQSHVIMTPDVILTNMIYQL